jgi:hypothetical protein
MALGGTHAGGRPPNYQICRILLHVPQALHKPFIHLYAVVVVCCMQMYGSSCISVQASDPWLSRPRSSHSITLLDGDWAMYLHK